MISEDIEESHDNCQTGKKKYPFVHFSITTDLGTHRFQGVILFLLVLILKKGTGGICK